MIYALMRVSTNSQDVGTQRRIIQDFCKRNNFVVDEWYEEKISSRSQERQIHKLVKIAKDGDSIITYELSRFTRGGVREAREIIDELVSNGVNIYFVSDNINITPIVKIDTKGKKRFVLTDPISKLTLDIMASFYELERYRISERTKDALKNKKDLGIPIGRPIGSKNKHPRVTKEDFKEIASLLDLGVPKKRICIIYKISNPTLTKYMIEYDYEPDSTQTK